jgi:heme-degrading monooxygenase HmoA
MITTQSAPEQLDQNIRDWRAAQATTVKQRGFEGNVLLVDRETGKFVIVSLWQNEADALASGAGLQQGWDQLYREGRLTAAPTIEYLEVAASNGSSR